MNVMCAVDGDQRTDRALAYAIDVCLAAGAALDVVTVSAPSPIAIRRRLQAREAHGRASAIAATAVAHAHRRGVTARAHTASGHAARAICALAVATEADLVVVGSRSRGPIAAAVRGSVASRVANECARAVTVVPRAPTRLGPLVDERLRRTQIEGRRRSEAAERVLARGMLG